MGSWYEERLFPVILDQLIGGADIMALRKELLAGVHGDVLEVGIGTGLNLGCYPDSVARIVGVEPNLGMSPRASQRMQQARVKVEIFEARGESMPFPERSFDAVVSTFTLCSIPDLDAAFEEIRRVMRPEASLFVLEHGLHPDPDVQRWQSKLAPINRVVACGCHLARDIRGLVETAGFRFEEIRELDIGGGVPRPFGHLTIGRAVARMTD